MTDKELIKKGFFPRELPPPFNTEDLANHLDTINASWNTIYSGLNGNDKKIFNESNWANISIPKVGLSRRKISIPNPLNQSKLSKTIADNWPQIESIINKSSISSSSPIIDIIRAVKTKESFSQFKSKRLSESYDKLFEVKTDISRFYGTIYTHSIPWLIHTKPVAKANRQNYLMLGNALDRDLRGSNSGQTIGIPIGPDTSLIVAEIITSLIDEKIQSKLNFTKSFRFIDDYYIYCDNYSDAEKSFKYIQSLLTEFQLDINEDKTRITESPFSFDSRWSIELGAFKFRKAENTQKTDLERFASLSHIHAKENPSDSVLLYTVQVLKNIPLHYENWKLYESILYRILITEPRTLPDVLSILSSHSVRVHKLKLRGILEKLIEIHIAKGHHFEVSWALWAFVEFRLKLKKKIAESILNSNDWISKLIILDIKQQNLVVNTLDTSILETDLTQDSLVNGGWLFTYQSIVSGWLSPTINVIDQNEYFKLLKDNSVSFYDKTRRIPQIQIKRPSPAEPNEYSASSIIGGGSGGGSSSY